MLNLKPALLIAFIGFLMMGCNGAVKPQSAAAQNITDNIVKVATTITVAEGKTFDGRGALYDWTGEGDCSQAEGMPPMFKLSAGASLKNLSMKNAPDGIHVKGSNVVITNINNLDVCEDAISIKLDKHKKAPNNIVISNSKFSHCEDKAIQITRGHNILIENNEFHNCAKALRVKEQATNIRFENNSIYNAKVAIKVTGGQGVAAGNIIDGAKVGIWVEEGGIFTDAGGNIQKRVIEQVRETNGGQYK